MRYYVYRFTFPNGLYYFGSTNDVLHRWLSKGTTYTHSNLPVGDAILHFGWDNIKRDVLCEVADKETAENIEYSLIDLFREKCYNVRGAIRDVNSGKSFCPSTFYSRLKNDPCRNLLKISLECYPSNTVDYVELVSILGISLGVFLDLWREYHYPRRKIKLRPYLEEQ